VEGDEVLSEQELRTKLKSLREGDSAVTKMVVQAHGEALYSTVVMVLDSGNDVGMEEVRLAVVDDESEGAQ
jgi:biopolymer transport protein ExbD